MIPLEKIFKLVAEKLKDEPHALYLSLQRTKESTLFLTLLTDNPNEGDENGRSNQKLFGKLE